MARIAHGIAGVYLALALVITAISFVRGPLTGAMAPLAGVRDQLAGREPLTISVVYGTEKEEWLQAAAARFEQEGHTVGGRPVEIDLQGLGSREMVLDVVAGELQPTVLSPASSLQIELLRDEWSLEHSGDILYSGDDAPQPLVVTPLVIVAWAERAQALELDDPQQLWDNLHDVLEDDAGWARFEHPEWGLANFGQTNPETSNSGLQALVLMAYAYHDKTSGLTNADILDDAGFRAWLDDIQRAVSDFPNSTGTLMEDMVLRGPSQYDFIVVYENLASANIETASGRWGDIQVYYPPANILSDHPYAILDGEWVSPEQREAAALFRDFLLSEEIQREALVEYGFRPANPQVPFDAPDSPFTRYESYGIRADIAQAVEVPPASVLNELIDLWGRQNYE